MNVTSSQNKNRDHVNDSKVLVRPHTYEMKQYPHDGLLEQLAFMLIRPPRFVYNPDILRPSRRAAQRFTVETLMVPFQITFYKQRNMDYVLLYLHGNGSSSFEGTLFLNNLPDKVGLVCFDFKGCGNRTEGDFITLGQQEAKDVDVVAKFLKEAGHKVVGWGRSMGAVSLLMSNQCDLMVADSAYSNLSVLCKESSSKFLPRACCCLFHCLFPCVFACIQCKVESLAGLDITRMDVLSRLQQMPPEKQICFIHGKSDTLVPPHHAEQLSLAFKGRKQLILFEGTHNSARPKEVLQKCFQFIEEGLKKSQIRETSFGKPKFQQMMIELPSLPISRNQQPKIQAKIENLQTSPLNKKKLQPLTIPNNSTKNHQISPSKSKANVDQQYCQIGQDRRIPINETLAEEEPFEKVSKSEDEANRLKSSNAVVLSTRP